MILFLLDHYNFQYKLFSSISSELEKTLFEFLCKLTFIPLSKEPSSTWKIEDGLLLGTIDKCAQCFPSLSDNINYLSNDLKHRQSGSLLWRLLLLAS